MSLDDIYDATPDSYTPTLEDVAVAALAALAGAAGMAALLVRVVWPRVRWARGDA